MNAYLFSVIGTVLVCALLTAIIPEGKTTSVIKGITRLVCVLAIIAPVLRFFKTGDITVEGAKKEENFFSESVIQADSELIQYYSELRVQEAEKALAKELNEKYAEEVIVSFDWSIQLEQVGGLYSVEKIRIDSINIKACNKISEEVERVMWLYVTENYCSEVLIE